MEVSKLNIEIGSNTTSAISGLNGLGDAMDKTSKKGKELGSTLSGSLKNSSNQSAQALTNLGRVAQDAPFGFVGIQNNLNPLLESFQRLKVETGSNAASLKALGASLIGPAGLGFALSIVGSALTYLTMSGGGLASLFGAVKTNAALLRDEFEKLSEKYGQQIGKIEQLKSVIINANLSNKERIAALNEYNKIADKTNQIDASQINNIELVNKAINQQTELIFKRAQARAAEGVITEKASKFLIALEKTGLSNIEDVNTALGGLQKSAGKGLLNDVTLQQGVRFALKVDKLKTAQSAFSEFQKSIGILGKLISAAPEKDENIKSIGPAISSTIAKSVKQSNPFDEAIKELENGFDEQKTKIINFNTEFIKLFSDLPEAGRNAIQSAITDSQKLDFLKIDEQITTGKIEIYKKYKKDLTDLNLELAKIKQDIENTIFKNIEDPEKGNKAKLGTPTGKVPAISVKLDGQGFKEFNEQMLQVQNTINGIVESFNQLLLPAFNAFFDVLLDGGSNAFEAFFDSLKQMFKKLLAAAASAAILSGILALIPGLGGAAAAAGGANFTSLFKKFSGLSFAQGGAVTGPSLVMAGDNASGKEAFIPFERLGEFANMVGGGRGSQVVVLDAVISGNDLRLMQRRSENSHRNNF